MPLTVISMLLRKTSAGLSHSTKPTVAVAPSQFSASGMVIFTYHCPAAAGASAVHSVSAAVGESA